MELLARLIRRVPRLSQYLPSALTSDPQYAVRLTCARQAAACGNGISFAAETTTDADYANRRNFFKVELWTKDGLHVEQLLFAGNSLDRARTVFAAFAKKRPRGRLTIRQRSRVLTEWPR